MSQLDPRADGDRPVPPTNGIRPDVPEPKDGRRVDEPVPTIVGPRPEGGPGGKVSVPQGIERLLTLAASNASWKEKVLADPVAAAAEARIALSESEKAILKATPRSSLEQMADSLARRQGMSPLGKTALVVGVSAAALLAAGFAVPSMMKSTRGIRPDVPPTNPHKLDPVGTVGGDRPEPEDAPPVPLSDSLEVALAMAVQEKRPVMAVFRHPKPPVKKWISDRPGSQGIRPDPVDVGIEQRAQNVLETNGKGFRAAAADARLYVARLARPFILADLGLRGTAEVEQKLADKYMRDFAAYEGALKRYGLDETKLPTAIFLAPDGSELSRLVQPQEESQLIEAIKAVPAQLTKWFDDHPEFNKRDIFPGPGIDVPLGGTAGIRIDIPPEKAK